ncbi:MAG: hypothetical protein IPO29_17975 [Anaerolineae bacterium]|nr:hypothetical protein [Anaerolineae bacterium]
MSNKNKSKRALLIANPGSGKAASRTALIEEVTGHLQNTGVKVDVSIAKPKEEAIPIARRAVKAGYGTVIALGVMTRSKRSYGPCPARKHAWASSQPAPPTIWPRAWAFPRITRKPAPSSRPARRASWTWARSGSRKGRSTSFSRWRPLEYWRHSIRTPRIFERESSGG